MRGFFGAMGRGGAWRGRELFTIVMVDATASPSASQHVRVRVL